MVTTQPECCRRPEAICHSSSSALPAAKQKRFKRRLVLFYGGLFHSVLDHPLLCWLLRPRCSVCLASSKNRNNLCATHALIVCFASSIHPGIATNPSGRTPSAQATEKTFPVPSVNGIPRSEFLAAVTIGHKRLTPSLATSRAALASTRVFSSIKASSSLRILYSSRSWRSIRPSLIKSDTVAPCLKPKEGTRERKEVPVALSCFVCKQRRCVYVFRRRQEKCTPSIFRKPQQQVPTGKMWRRRLHMPLEKHGPKVIHHLGANRTLPGSVLD